MKSSDDLTALLPALIAARLDFPTITRNCSAIARGGRTYQYADLAAIVEATAPILAQNGLVLVQALDDGDDGQLCVSSTLYHISGQWLSEALSVPKPTSMQEAGSISTYLRRYQQSALLGIVTEDDDDAASTAGASTVPAPQPAMAPVVPATHGHASPPAARRTSESPERPTEAHISALRALAMQDCHTEPDELDDRIRRTMGLKATASVAPRLLSRSMTMAQYMASPKNWRNF
jgi:ERF superfamily